MHINDVYKTDTNHVSTCDVQYTTCHSVGSMVGGHVTPRLVTNLVHALRRYHGDVGYISAELGQVCVTWARSDIWDVAAMDARESGDVVRDLRAIHDVGHRDRRPRVIFYTLPIASLM